jgi:hypothetical protein
MFFGQVLIFLGRLFFFKKTHEFNLKTINMIFINFQK